MAACTETAARAAAVVMGGAGGFGGLGGGIGGEGMDGGAWSEQTSTS